MRVFTALMMIQNTSSSFSSAFLINWKSFGWKLLLSGDWRHVMLTLETYKMKERCFFEFELLHVAYDLWEDIRAWNCDENCFCNVSIFWSLVCCSFVAFIESKKYQTWNFTNIQFSVWKVFCFQLFYFSILCWGTAKRSFTWKSSMKEGKLILITNFLLFYVTSRTELNIQQQTLKLFVYPR